MVMILLAFLLILQSLPPGIRIQWLAPDSQARTFLVYRAEVPASGETPGEADFALIEEISAGPDLEAYTFLDTRSIPGRHYLYRVEAVDNQGQMLASNIVPADALQALPGQALLATTFAFILYGLASITKEQRIERHELRNQTAV
jgi:hypothetical protein